MKAEEFVKQKYPRAFSERFSTRGPFGIVYYLIWKDPSREKRRLGEGDTASKAWVDAKLNILEDQQDS